MEQSRWRAPNAQDLTDIEGSLDALELAEASGAASGAAGGATGRSMHAAGRTHMFGKPLGPVETAALQRHNTVLAKAKAARMIGAVVPRAERLPREDLALMAQLVRVWVHDAAAFPAETMDILRNVRNLLAPLGFERVVAATLIVGGAFYTLYTLATKVVGTRTRTRTNTHEPEINQLDMNLSLLRLSILAQMQLLTLQHQQERPMFIRQRQPYEPKNNNNNDDDDDNDCCSICLDKLMCAPTLALPCAHRLHESCLFAMLDNDCHTCPLCRTDIFL